jgi:hypothetical protein
MHACCPANEYAALRYRMMRPTPRSTCRGKAAFKREINLFKKQLHPFKLEPWSRQQVVDHCKTTSRKIRLSQALISLRKHPISPKDARITCFVKADKMDGVERKCAQGKPNKPRAIMFRQDRYVLEHSRFVKPVEGAMKKLKGRCKYPIFAKGLDVYQRGQLFKKKLSRFSNPQIFSVDASAFDGSVRQYALNAVHGLVTSCVGHSSLFDRLHSWRRVNKGTTMQGRIKFKIVARRMSGDSDTSMGNCFIMASAICAALRAVGITKYELLNDGDDCLVITEGRVIPPNAFDLEMAQMGFVTTGEYQGSLVEDPEWCRSHFVTLDSGIRVCGNLSRKLSTILCSHKHYSSPKSGERAALAVGMCLATTEADTPILGSIGRTLVSVLEPVVRKDDKFERALKSAIRSNFTARRLWRSPRVVRRHLSRTQKVPISPQARASYERAFKCSSDLQIQIERWFETQLPQLLRFDKFNVIDELDICSTSHFGYPRPIDVISLEQDC